MMRTSLLWATLALMAVAALAEHVSAGQWRRGPTCRHSARDPASSSATIVVRLPADAKLSFDGSPTASTGGTRFFTTPPLNPGRELTYTIRAETNRSGQTVAMTKQVTVRACSTTEVDFGDMTSAAGSIADLLKKITDLVKVIAAPPENPPKMPPNVAKLLGVKPEQ